MMSNDEIENASYTFHTQYLRAQRLDTIQLGLDTVFAIENDAPMLLNRRLAAATDGHHPTALLIVTGGRGDEVAALIAQRGELNRKLRFACACALRKNAQYEREAIEYRAVPRLFERLVQLQW